MIFASSRKSENTKADDKEGRESIPALFVYRKILVMRVGQKKAISNEETELLFTLKRLAICHWMWALFIEIGPDG